MDEIIDLWKRRDESGLNKLYDRFAPVWFGVIILMALEISFTTPPFGLLLFVMKGVAPPDTRMLDIYLAAIPYIFCAMLVVLLLILIPQLALFLPSLGQ